MEIEKIDDNIYEVPIGYRPGMRVPGRIFVSAALREMVEPGTVDQVANVATLPGSLLARDAHGLNPGAGRVRLALVAEPSECIEAAQRIVDYARANRR